MKGKINMKEKNKIDKGTIKGFAVLIIGLGLVFGFGPAARTATPSLQPATSSGFQFVADAYGTYATLGNVVVAGKTAVSSLGACGHVVLNEQITKIKSRSASFTVNMIHVFIDVANVLNIPIGTQIIVSHAFSGLTSGVQGTLDGQAYGTKAGVGHTITSGPSAIV